MGFPSTSMSEKQQGLSWVGDMIRRGYWFCAGIRSEYSMMVGLVVAAYHPTLNIVGLRERGHERRGDPMSDMAEVVDQYLTIEEVSMMFKLPLSWLYERTRKGEIPYVRFGKYIRFDRAKLEVWAAERARN